jgi:hypothetical protein
LSKKNVVEVTTSTTLISRYWLMVIDSQECITNCLFFTLLLLASLAKRGDVFRFWAKPKTEKPFLLRAKRAIKIQSVNLLCFHNQRTKTPYIVHQTSHIMKLRFSFCRQIIQQIGEFICPPFRIFIRQSDAIQVGNNDGFPHICFQQFCPHFLRSRIIGVQTDGV